MYTQKKHYLTVHLSFAVSNELSLVTDDSTPQQYAIEVMGVTEMKRARTQAYAHMHDCRMNMRCSMTGDVIEDSLILIREAQRTQL